MRCTNGEVISATSLTFEELRTHLGIETQRQWSDKAIARSTPALFGLFSVVVLVAIKMLKDTTIPILKCTWYRKLEATFSDVIAFVRRHIWSARYFANSSEIADLINSGYNLLTDLLDQVCYAD